MDSKLLLFPQTFLPAGPPCALWPLFGVTILSPPGETAEDLEPLLRRLPSSPELSAEEADHLRRWLVQWEQWLALNFETPELALLKLGIAAPRPETSSAIQQELRERLRPPAALPPLTDELLILLAHQQDRNDHSLRQAELRAEYQLRDTFLRLSGEEALASGPPRPPVSAPAWKSEPGLLTRRLGAWARWAEKSCAPPACFFTYERDILPILRELMDLRDLGGVPWPRLIPESEDAAAGLAAIYPQAELASLRTEWQRLLAQGASQGFTALAVRNLLEEMSRTLARIFAGQPGEVDFSRQMHFLQLPGGNFSSFLQALRGEPFSPVTAGAWPCLWLCP